MVNITQINTKQYSYTFIHFSAYEKTSRSYLQFKRYSNTDKHSVASLHDFTASKKNIISKILSKALQMETKAQ